MRLQIIKMDLNEIFKSEEKSFDFQGHTFKFKEVTIEDESLTITSYQLLKSHKENPEEFIKSLAGKEVTITEKSTVVI